MDSWWGYLHVDGTVQVKPVFHRPEVTQSLLDDAQDSPFVKRVFEPFQAVDREDAIRQIKEKL